MKHSFLLSGVTSFLILTGGAAIGQDTLLGTVSYPGGFVRDLSLPLSPSKVVKKFNIRIPSFCGQVDILEAKTVTEGVEESAKSLGKGEYSVNGGAGMRISAIRVSLNGPTSSSCVVPIYEIAGGQQPQPQSYRERRAALLTRIDGLARRATQQGDIQVLRMVQDVETLIVTQTPAILSPYDDLGYWTAVLNSANRSCDTLEGILNAQ